MYPLGDPPLTELGTRQAHLLGERLAKEGFSGRIISSPFRRTMETAIIIAEHTGSLVYPFAPIHEILRTEAQSRFKGISIERLREFYPDKIDPEADLDYPWWASEGEDTAAVYERVRRGVCELELKFSGEPLLFVAHGASLSGLFLAYGIDAQKGRFVYNCSLSIISPGEIGDKPVYCDVSHLSPELTTSNAKTKAELEREKMSAEYTAPMELPDELLTLRGKRLLHIGDTPSRDYPYYKTLIEKIKPDVIVHTGDLADEVKVGRHPELTEEYISKIELILSILESSGAEIFIVPGNNDLEEEIARLCPVAKICKSGATVDIDGIKIRVAHAPTVVPLDAPLALHGHSTRGELWRPGFNGEGCPLRFNALWASTLISLSDKKFVTIKRP